MERRIYTAAALVLLALVAGTSAHAAGPPAGFGAAAAATPAQPGAGSSVRARVPAARVAILARDQRSVLRRGRLALRLRYPRVGRVRVFVRARRSPATRRTVALVRGRSFVLRRPARRRTLALALTRRGRALMVARVRACRPLSLLVTTRARRYAVRADLPPFSRRNRVGRSRDLHRARTLAADRSACRGGGREVGGRGGGGADGPGAGNRPSTRPPGGGAAPTGPGPGDPQQGGSGLRAGAAESDITPPIGTPMFAYTGRSLIAGPDNVPGYAQTVISDPGSEYHAYSKTFLPSEGIHTRVLARALVLERDGEKLALVQSDLGGVPYALVQEVTKRVEATGVTLDRLLLSATHTHASTGPIWPADSAGYGLLGGDLFDPRIFDLTAAGIADSIIAADAKLEQARLGIGSTELRGASNNRNFKPFRANSDVPADEAEARSASTDHGLSVIRVDAVSGDRPLAVWSNFAIHPTSFGGDNLLFSGDNVGFATRIAEQAIEAESGGADVVNVWTNGNEGDISPNGSADVVAGQQLQYVNNSFGSAHQAGARVARGTVRAWRDAGAEMTRTPELSVRRALLDFDGTTADGRPVGPNPVLGAAGVTAPDGTCAPADDLAGRGQGSKLAQATGPLAPLQASVSIARIGSLGVAAFPFEVTRQMGRRIRDEAFAATGGEVDGVALAGLTNGYLSYAATPEEYEQCHYEGSFTLFGEHQGSRLRDFAKGLTIAMFQGGDGPAAGIEPPPTGLAVPEPLPPRETPDAGKVVTQPAALVSRYGRVGFSWFGGDPAIDAPRGRALVTLEREQAGGEWTAVGSDEGFRDTTRREMGDTWLETWQFDECDPLGTYRFSVLGVADKGAGPADYEVRSNEFQLGPIQGATLGPVSVGNGVARVRATYPDPGPDSLLALPRFLRTGTATLEVDGQPVVARPDPASPDFVASVAPGADVKALQASDACGNAAAAG